MKNSNSNEIVTKSITSAIRGTFYACDLLEQEKHRRSITISQKTKAKTDFLQKAADERALSSLYSKICFIPILRNNLIKKHKAAEAEHTEAVEKILTEIDQHKRKSSQIESTIYQLRKNAEKLARVRSVVKILGLPPRDIEERAVNNAGRIELLLVGKRGNSWGEKIKEASNETVSIVKDWVTIHKKIMEREARQRTSMAAPALLKLDAPKVFLPIPLSMSDVAKSLGAKRDQETERGISPWYATLEMDLKPFRNLLPLAYRPTPPKISFPPMPMRAAGQNLWNVFDNQSWRKIKSAATSSVGNRCVLCGGRGGYISEKILTPEERRFSVDCHEVWDWIAPHPETGVGVQKLNKLLIVCPSCHACFHEGHFVKRAETLGLSEEVRAYIEKKRMLITRSDINQLNTALDRERERMDMVNGIDNWAIDLSHLGEQHFMNNHISVLNERNSSDVAPEAIAGIEFETLSGEHFEKRTIQQVYSDMIIASRQNYTAKR